MHAKNVIRMKSFMLVRFKTRNYELKATTVVIELITSDSIPFLIVGAIENEW
jgi:hypothetical protein